MADTMITSATEQTTTVNDDGTETESAKKTNDYFIMDERQLPIAVRSFQMDRLLLFVAIRIVSIGKLGLITVFYRANQAIMCVQFN